MTRRHSENAGHAVMKMMGNYDFDPCDCFNAITSAD